MSFSHEPFIIDEFRKVVEKIIHSMFMTLVSNTDFYFTRQLKQTAMMPGITEIIAVDFSQRTGEVLNIRALANKHLVISCYSEKY